MPASSSSQVCTENSGSEKSFPRTLILPLSLLRWEEALANSVVGGRGHPILLYDREPIAENFPDADVLAFIDTQSCLEKMMNFQARENNEWLCSGLGRDCIIPLSGMVTQVVQLGDGVQLYPLRGEGGQQRRQCSLGRTPSH